MKRTIATLAGLADHGRRDPVGAYRGAGGGRSIGGHDHRHHLQRRLLQ